MSCSSYEKLDNELYLALNSTDLTILRKLTNSRDVNVRRCLAKNNYIDTNIADSLVLDPVLNVSYIASLHKNCSLKRRFKPYHIAHQCVQCTVNEDKLDCTVCEDFKYAN